MIKEEKKNIMEIEKLTQKINEQKKEILSYKNQIAQLKKEKEMLEERLERIGIEFDKRIAKIVENNLAKDRNSENLRLSINKLLLDVRQQNVDFKNSLFEVKEILQEVAQKIGFLFDNASKAMTEQAAVSLEKYKDYSLLEDLSEMLKNN
ncbi:hypothetical protein TKV_c18210 [Thermoanaerobacter kivui]|uniref:Uncharacterized protein n=2 Tax=Thermoanaerobacter kivui TaxID=2325 RepID=A0A097AT27_THEKI|nr:hypothetical protein [Thermoanaerobacter kivui]AIS52971.1 hypothetical protein TKV_c18210 [Thermoanaerobacter kivui]